MPSKAIIVAATVRMLGEDPIVDPSWPSASRWFPKVYPMDGTKLTNAILYSRGCAIPRGVINAHHTRS